MTFLKRIWRSSIRVDSIESYIAKLNDLLCLAVMKVIVENGARLIRASEMTKVFGSMSLDHHNFFKSINFTVGTVTMSWLKKYNNTLRRSITEILFPNPILRPLNFRKLEERYDSAIVITFSKLTTFSQIKWYKYYEEFEKRRERFLRPKNWHLDMLYLVFLKRGTE